MENYNWKKAFAEFKKLKTPEEIWQPETMDLYNNTWEILLSERKSGKTTQLLLFGLVCFKLFGIRVEYLRQTEEMIAPKYTQDLYALINQLGYVNKLFPDYNTVVYKAKRWYLANIDEEGNTVQQSGNPVCVMNSLDHALDLKSSYVSLNGDLILFDEFLGRRYTRDEFLLLCHMIDTIRRFRLKTRVFLAANTISPYSTYFEEMGIKNEILKLKRGQTIHKVTPLGLPMQIQWIDTTIKASEKRRVGNNLFYGFGNSKLASVVGGEGWDIANYPHLYEYTEDSKCLFRDIYFKLYDIYKCAEVRHDDRFGYFLYIRPYTSVPDDDTYVFTCEQPTKANEHFYQTPTNKLERFVMNCFRDKKVLYATNDDGRFIDEILKKLKKELYKI